METILAIFTKRSLIGVTVVTIIWVTVNQQSRQLQNFRESRSYIAFILFYLLWAVYVNIRALTGILKIYSSVLPTEHSFRIALISYTSGMISLEEAGKKNTVFKTFVQSLQSREFLNSEVSREFGPEKFESMIKLNIDDFYDSQLKSQNHPENTEYDEIKEKLFHKIIWLEVAGDLYDQIYDSVSGNISLDFSIEEFPKWVLTHLQKRKKLIDSNLSQNLLD